MDGSWRRNDDFASDDAEPRSSSAEEVGSRGSPMRMQAGFTETLEVSMQRCSLCPQLAFRQLAGMKHVSHGFSCPDIHPFPAVATDTFPPLLRTNPLMKAALLPIPI